MRKFSHRPTVLPPACTHAGRQTAERGERTARLGRCRRRPHPAGLSGTGGSTSEQAGHLFHRNLGGDAVNGEWLQGTAAIGARTASVKIVNSTFFDPIRLPAVSYLYGDRGSNFSISGCEFEFPVGIRRPLFYAEDSAV